MTAPARIRERWTAAEKQRAVDFLTTAVEGGINYWAEVKDYERCDGEGREFPFELACVSVRETDEPTNPWVLVEAVQIARVLRRVQAQEFPPFFNQGYSKPLFLRLLNAQYGDPDDFDYDADDADSVMQLTMLGSIVYG